MNISIRDISQREIDEYYKASGFDAEFCFEDRKAVDFTDENENSATLYIDNPTIERLGIKYIQENTSLRYSDFFKEWQATLSLNVYYNDIDRYPENIIDVEYVENMQGELTEIYRNKETGKLYMRQLASNEDFARWLTCRRDFRYQYTDCGCARANIIFKNENQTEKITYDDWNGHAAYSGTFNSNFRTEAV
jgi:hypothetical protein